MFLTLYKSWSSRYYLQLKVWSSHHEVTAKTQVFKFYYLVNIIWGKVFKNGPSKICGRQPFKNLK